MDDLPLEVREALVDARDSGCRLMSVGILRAYCERVTKERNLLHAFAKEIMEAWPSGGVDGFYLQEIGIKYKLLARSTPTQEEMDEWGLEPDDDWWRPTPLLTGEKAT